MPRARRPKGRQQELNLWVGRGASSVDSTLIAIVICLVTLAGSWWIAKKYGDVAGTRAAIAYEKEKEARDTAEFRNALRVEIERNLGQAKRILDWLRQGLKLPDDVHEVTSESLSSGDAYRVAVNLARSSLTEWSMDVWRSQHPGVLSSISREISLVQEFYSELRVITAMHQTLCNLRREKDEDRRSQPGGEMVWGVDSADQSLQGAYRGRLDVLLLGLTRMVDRGNPLADRTSGMKPDLKGTP
jgi:hypothetical protein